MSQAFTLRSHRPGDIGWVIHRHGALYASELGWNSNFEALVAEVGAQFLRTYDAECERCWIAEREGRIVGSVFLTRNDAHTAKLRLLYVEPDARGLGIGERLVRECVEAARRMNYRSIELWTMSVLVSARRIYEAQGFVLEEESPYADFGPALTAQRWRLTFNHLESLSSD